MRRISSDERIVRKSHRYVTMFCDADTRRLVFATPGKDAATFDAFAKDLAARGGDAKAITDVSLDMGLAYQAGARDHCPNAVVSFDPFHVVALANEAMDQVRRAEVKHEASLKGCCWATLKDSAHWTNDQITQMHWLQHSGLKTARAWRLKQRLREVFARCTDPAAASALLARWDQLGDALSAAAIHTAGGDDEEESGRDNGALPLRLEQRLCRSDQRTCASGQGAR